MKKLLPLLLVCVKLQAADFFEPSTPSYPSAVLTNNASFATTISNNVTIDPSHKLIVTHVSGAGTAPTAVTNVACGGGSVLTLDANAHDVACKVKIVTGAAPNAGPGLIFRLTYGAAFATTPHVGGTYSSIPSAILATRSYISNETTTSFDVYIVGGSTLTANTNYEWTFLSVE